MEDRMDIAAAEQIARLLAQVEPLSRDNERLAADNARLARDAAEAGRAHQGVVRDAVADRLRAQRQVRQRASPVPDGIRLRVPGRADIQAEHGKLDDEGLGAVAVQAAGEDEGAAAGRRHSPRRRDRGAGAQGARARGGCKSRMWLFAAPACARPIYIYEYNPTRGRQDGRRPHNRHLPVGLLRRRGIGSLSEFSRNEMGKL